MDGSINIRKALLDDVIPMAKLLGELFAIEDDFVFDEESHTKALTLMINTQHSTLYVATINNRLIGMVTMQPLISTAMGGYVGLIEDVIVAHDFRGQGIGKQLLMTMIEESKLLGYTRLSLSADKRNDVAIDFYRTLGFEASNMRLLYRH